MNYPSAECSNETWKFSLWKISRFFKRNMISKFSSRSLFDFLLLLLYSMTLGYNFLFYLLPIAIDHAVFTEHYWSLLRWSHGEIWSITKIWIKAPKRDIVQLGEGEKQNMCTHPHSSSFPSLNKFNNAMRFKKLK